MQLGTSTVGYSFSSTLSGQRQVLHTEIRVHVQNTRRPHLTVALVRVGYHGTVAVAGIIWRSLIR